MDIDSLKDRNKPDHNESSSSSDDSEDVSMRQFLEFHRRLSLGNNKQDIPKLPEEKLEKQKSRSSSSEKDLLEQVRKN